MKYSPHPTNCMYCNQILIPPNLEYKDKTCNAHKAKVFFSENNMEITIQSNNVQLDYYKRYQHSILWNNRNRITIFHNNQLIFDLSPDELIQHLQRYIDIAVFL